MLPKRVWWGDPASHPLLPPVSLLPCALSGNTLQGQLGVGRGPRAWKVLCRAECTQPFFNTFLFPLRSCCCRAPLRAVLWGSGCPSRLLATLTRATSATRADVLPLGRIIYTMFGAILCHWKL